MKKTFLSVCLCITFIMSLRVHVQKDPGTDKTTFVIDFHPHSLKDEEVRKIIGTYCYTDDAEETTF